ncbi:hypothetical protein ACIQ8G_26330, partial [Streptomyces sp. NPDC094154]|uniref:hypothetical protein n=1 Tax=Streptomyces sp. NPDC094154 TaxID=3366059 RepID=UPI003817C8CA
MTNRQPNPQLKPELSTPTIKSAPEFVPEAQTLSALFVPEARRVMEWPEANSITHRRRRAIRAGTRETSEASIR